MPLTKVDLAIGAGLVLVTFAAVLRFWQPGIASDNDMLIAVYRAFELDQSWHRQLFYPRLGMGLNFTYGGPLFEFYAPLVSYATLAFHWAGAGFVEASKAVFSLSLLSAGVGAFVYARDLFKDRRAALVAGVTYEIAPYLLGNLYERGAAAEQLALSLLPWAVWALHHTVRDSHLRWVWTSAGLVALLSLAHNITALFAIPVLCVYLGLLAAPTRAWRGLVRVALAIAFGLALSAFYWAPALAELGYVKAASVLLVSGLNPDDNLSSLTNLVQPWLFFDYWGPMRFHLSLWQAVVAALAAASLAVTRRLPHRSTGILLGLVAALLFLQISESGLFWQRMPLVRFIQFPWRLLGLASFFIALLGGSLFCGERLRGRAGALVAAAGLGLIMVASLWNLSPNLSPIWLSFSSAQASNADLYERGRFGTPLYFDYMPIWTVLDSASLSKPIPSAADSPPNDLSVPNVRIVKEGIAGITVDIEADSPFSLRLHKLYFPGWQVYISGQPVSTGPGGDRGIVKANLPAGKYVAEARFEETPFRLTVDVLSFLALGVWGAVIIARWRRTPALFVAGTLLLLLAVLVLRHQGIGEPPRQPVAISANLEDEIQLLGFRIGKNTWRAGDHVPVQLYWMARKRPSDNYTVFVHVTTVDGSRRIAQADSEPVSGYGPTSAWEPGELVMDELVLRLDENVLPGQYSLLVGMYNTDTVRNLQVVQGGRVLPGNRIVLTDVVVGGQ